MGEPTVEKLIPLPTPDTLPFWRAAREGRLMLPRCEACGPFFYPRAFCPKCGSSKLDWIEASGRATLYSYVINVKPLAPGYAAPYVIAVVSLEEGPRMMANILDVEPTPDTLVLDMPLVVRFEQRGELAIPQFVPAKANS
jgi:uncharacterized OB-fold protein